MQIVNVNFICDMCNFTKLLDGYAIGELSRYFNPLQINIILLSVKPEVRAVETLSVTSNTVNISIIRDRSIRCYGTPVPLNYFINITGVQVVLSVISIQLIKKIIFPVLSITQQDW